MIDISRSIGIFDPSTYTEDIHIIGAGATGSHICENLIVHGINGSQIHVYDFDKVEEHNVSNQLYTYQDIGKLKVKALHKKLEKDYKESIKAHNKRLDSKIDLSGVVFLLVDSFEARKEIFKGLQYKPKVKLVVETRLDARAGQVMTLNPSNIQHVKYFDTTIFEDDDEGQEVSVCGTRQTVSATVKLLSSVAVWEFMKWTKDINYIGNKMYFSTDPWFLMQSEIKLEKK